MIAALAGRRGDALTQAIKVLTLILLLVVLAPVFLIGIGILGTCAVMVDQAGRTGDRVTDNSPKAKPARAGRYESHPSKHIAGVRNENVKGKKHTIVLVYRSFYQYSARGQDVLIESIGNQRLSDAVLVKDWERLDLVARYARVSGGWNKEVCPCDDWD